MNKNNNKIIVMILKLIFQIKMIKNEKMNSFFFNYKIFYKFNKKKKNNL